MWLLLAVVIDVSRFRSPLVTYDVNCARTWPLSNRINVFYGIAFASVQLLLYFFVFVYCRASFMSVRWLDGINFSLFKMLFQYYLSHIHARIPQNEWAHNNLMIVKFIWLIVSFSCWFFSLCWVNYLFWSFLIICLFKRSDFQANRTLLFQQSESLAW